MHARLRRVSGAPSEPPFVVPRRGYGDHLDEKSDAFLTIGSIVALMPRKLDPKSKAGFVRAQPHALSAAAVVSKAKAQGFKLDERYVYSVRTQMNKAAKAKKKNGTPALVARVARGPVRRIVRAQGERRDSGLAREIERIVEQKVNAMLASKLGALFASDLPPIRWTV
jgi:hypothetical protein